MKTTLNKICEHYPREGGWKRLLKNLGKTKADDEPLAITTIIDRSGLDDALWCLRAVDGYEKEMRLMAVDFARSDKPLTKSSIAAIDAAESYAHGQSTYQEMVVATRYACNFSARATGDRAAHIAAIITANLSPISSEEKADYLRFVCAEIEQRGVEE